MATETFSSPAQRPWFERGIDLTRINLEVPAYIVLIALSLIAHLWNLGGMALHHDESIHAWMSWKFYTGEGGFTCANGSSSQTYCYDPVYHGPSLYVLTVISYFLFGDGDAQARLPMALAGVTMVASCWWLRPYLGRRGALIAAVLLSFSPTLLYYTRFARHDGLMILWELWMVIGLLRYLDTGKAGYLYLLAASLALAVATHELYYILFFIFGILVLTRIISESPLARYLNAGFAVVLALCMIFIGINPPLPVGEGLYLGEKMFLVAATLLLGWLASLVWDRTPIVLPRLRSLWHEQRGVLWAALAILLGLHTVLYTNFFSDLAGFFGPYYGLAYWLGSQQEFARGDQPWYYYFMLIGIYEPLGYIFALGTAVYLFGGGLLRRQRERRAERASSQPVPEQEPASNTAPSRRKRKQQAREAAAAADDEPEDREDRTDAPAAQSDGMPPVPAAASAPVGDVQAAAAAGAPTAGLFPLIVVIWYFSAIVIFSWAGEKMPWLVVHMALPGNLLLAWTLGRLLNVIPPLRAHEASADAAQASDGHASESPNAGGHWYVLLIAPVLVIMLLALGVAVWRFYGVPQDASIANAWLQGLVPLLVFGAMLYALLTLWMRAGSRVVLAMIALTFAVLLGAYMIRASWLVVYHHPDTPIEPLIYTQTSPDVPRYVAEVRELAINQTRNYRTAEDVAGGLSMPVVVSNGDENGAGSLAWPLRWYFRDFQNVIWIGAAELREPTTQTFEVDLPDGSTGPAPVLMLFSPHVTSETRAVLEQAYTQPYGTGGVFNWWFPEGNKCNPEQQGYKRFYYDALTSRNLIAEEPPSGCLDPEAGPAAFDELWANVHNPFMPFVWPFLPEHLPDTLNYLLYRELPEPLRPGSRDMQVWVRGDLVGGGGAPVASSAATVNPAIRLQAGQVLGSPSELSGPTSIVQNSEGLIYVADTQNHRIRVYESDGTLVDTIGSHGSDEGEFYEPRGLAVDDDDNLYVADTWNARVVKLDPEGEWITSWGTGTDDMGDGRVATMTGADEEGNEANPLGFFGPRSLAIDDEGRIYIADTGNRRIVVTDDTGEFVYQWGQAGSAPGSFNEPVTVAISESGILYVADSWNGRVQVFQQDEDGRYGPTPVHSWPVNGWQADTYLDPALATGPDGLVYVSVPSQQHVLAADPQGTVNLVWSGAGEDRVGLQVPSGLLVDDEGRVYVVDRDASRVLRFTLPDLLPAE